MISQWFAALAGRSRMESLPPRIIGAILARQDRSEVLIGWVQLAVVLTFTALYLLAPPPANQDIAFDLVPYALGIYFLFTVIRLRAAYVTSLAPWFLVISVIADMVLLMATIWSFHIKYGQPPSFYLKAPTLLYVFIFISLRALRFQARYVLLAGFTAALGWLVLVGYAATYDSGQGAGGGIVTRDFIDYMTSNRILLGAEFDKVISIIVVTLILSVAISRARGALIDAVVRGSEARDLARFFDDDVARHITGDDAEASPGTGTIRDAAVLVIDIRDFTKIAASCRPDEVMALLADYQRRMVPLVQRAGGTIDKFLGDGIMASFGAARPSETYAADALRAMDAVMAEAQAWGRARAAGGTSQLSIGAAMAAGQVVFGAVGDENRLEYTVIGDAVNLAAKLEKHNKVAKSSALTTEDAYRKAVAQGYVPEKEPETLAHQALEGIPLPIDIVVLSR